MRSMFVQVPMPSGPAGVMFLEVSVPLVPQLLDGDKYYMEPKSLEDDTARRPRADVALAGEAGRGVRQRRGARQAVEAALPAPTTAPRRIPRAFNDHKKTAPV